MKRELFLWVYIDIIRGLLVIIGEYLLVYL